VVDSADKDRINESFEWLKRVLVEDDMKTVPGICLISPKRDKRNNYYSRYSKQVLGLHSKIKGMREREREVIAILTFSSACTCKQARSS
jgi:hypothetical protein